MIKRGKKGVSPIITTVLLLLIAVSLVVLLGSFLYPYVQNMLEKGQECFDIAGQITIDSKYTCFNSEDLKVQAAIKRGTKEIEIGGFKISAIGGGTSSVFDVKEGTVEGVTMLDGETPEKIELPERGGERTYLLNVPSITNVDSIVVVALRENGETCDETETRLDIERCL